MAGSCLICFLLIGLISGCKKDSPETPNKPVDLISVPHEGWMGQLDSLIPGLSLGALTIPGTHLSGADWYHVSDINIQYVTQRYKVYDQLEMGIRFLDLRLGFDSNDCPSGLGLYNDEVNQMFMNEDIYLNQSFKSVLSSIDAFLNENPTEMVILLVRQVHSSLDLNNFWGMVTAELTVGGFPADRIVDYNPTRDAELPLLSKCRNKLLIIGKQQAIGIENFTFSWPLNTAGYSEWAGRLNYHVQDRSSWDCFVLDEKSGYVNQLIDQCRSVPKASQPENLFLNFTSAYDICSDREYIAANMNITTFNYLAYKATNRNPCGIIVMDFAGDLETAPVDFAMLLISINFNKD
jgi:hypothetical protein